MTDQDNLIEEAAKVLYEDLGGNWEASSGYVRDANIRKAKLMRTFWTGHAEPAAHGDADCLRAAADHFHQAILDNREFFVDGPNHSADAREWLRAEAERLEQSQRDTERAERIGRAVCGYFTAGKVDYAELGKLVIEQVEGETLSR